MAISDFFAKVLKAPLNNIRWSWGAVRPDGCVILRLWQDEVCKIGDTIYVTVQWEDHLWGGDEESRNGRNERSEHIKLILAGTKAFAVVQQAVDVSASPREIKDYMRDSIYSLGNTPLYRDGTTLFPVIGKVPVESI